jgi:hypothetical protein
MIPSPFGMRFCSAEPLPVGENGGVQVANGISGGKRNKIDNLRKFFCRFG